MDTQTSGTEGITPGAIQPSEASPPVAKQPPLDPLRRVLVPIEKRTSNGTIVFRTTDRRVYARVDEGMPMHRVDRKVRGKAARAADKRARREARRIQERRAAMKAGEDPREDQHPDDPQTDSSPDKGDTRPAEGGAGTGTKTDPATDAQPDEGNDR